MAAAGSLRRDGRRRAVELFAAEYPHVAFVIPHLGSFADDWAVAARASSTILVRRPNVYHRHLRGSPFDLLGEAVGRAGAHKVLFGSDGPWLHPGVELAKVRRARARAGGGPPGARREPAPTRPAGPGLAARTGSTRGGPVRRATRYGRPVGSPSQLMTVDGTDSWPGAVLDADLVAARHFCSMRSVTPSRPAASCRSSPHIRTVRRTAMSAAASRISRYPWPADTPPGRPPPAARRWPPGRGRATVSATPPGAPPRAGRRSDRARADVPRGDPQRELRRSRTLPG